MFEPDDVARSLRRYIGLLLPEGPPPDWTMRLERREVKDEERPVGVINVGEVSTIQARETFEQGNVVDQYPVTIYLYPPVEADAQRARREGDAYRSALHQLLKYGFPLSTLPVFCLDENGRPKAGPFHVPLWDWDGIPSEGPAEGREPPEEAAGSMRIPSESLVCENLTDEDDERRRTVFAEFRIQLEMPGRTDDRGGGTVSGISGAFGGEP